MNDHGIIRDGIERTPVSAYPVIDQELRDAIADLKKPPLRAVKEWDALVYNTAISDVLALIALASERALR